MKVILRSTFPIATEQAIESNEDLMMDMEKYGYEKSICIWKSESFINETTALSLAKLLRNVLEKSGLLVGDGVEIALEMTK